MSSPRRRSNNMTSIGGVELSVHELRVTELAFSFVDKNHDGKIEIKELQKAMEAIGEHPSKKDLKQMIHIIEKRNDARKIGFPEFCDFMKLYVFNRQMDESQIYARRNSILETFRRMDQDASGKLDKEEILHGLTSHGVTLNKEEAQSMFEEMDRNHDNSVDYEEFVSLLFK